MFNERAGLSGALALFFSILLLPFIFNIDPKILSGHLSPQYTICAIYIQLPLLSLDS
jgi:hypothetical protein